MAKVIFDLIQRFEVENGVPRLVSTNIQVIEGGEDLMSLATSMLVQLGFYDKFEENRTSQYIGYKLKNRRKGFKRYQLVLTPRKEGLCISISQDILKPEILEIDFYSFVGNWKDTDYEMIVLGIFWVLPSQRDIFLKTFKYPEIEKLHNQTKGSFWLSPTPGNLLEDYPPHFSKKQLAKENSYVILEEDSLFPYMWQTTVDSLDVLKEFLSHFAKILMEQP